MAADSATANAPALPLGSQEAQPIADCREPLNLQVGPQLEDSLEDVLEDVTKLMGTAWKTTAK